MTHSLPPGQPRALSSLTSADDVQAGDPVGAALEGATAGREALAAGGRIAPTTFAFVLFAMVELAFVFGLLVLTKLPPAQVVKITAETTGIAVGGFFGRSAVVFIGRRLISGPGKQ